MKPTDNGQKFTQASPPTQSEVNNFKEPSSWFELNQNILKAIEKNGFQTPFTRDNSATNTKFEGKSDDGRPYKYFGQMKGESKEGRGQLQFMDKNCEFIVSSFENNKPVGESSIYFSNGDYFKGKISGNSMKEGILYLNNGNRYEGTFADNMYEGQGIFFFTDKRKYKGGFQQGEKTGFGVMNWIDGSSYEGEWVNGHQHGKGKFIDKKGGVHIGEFYEGKLLKKHN